MKRSLLIISLILTSATGLALVGTAIYRWLTEGDKLVCVSNKFSFGCATTFGWVLTGVGTVVFVGALRELPRITNPLYVMALWKPK